MDDHDPIVARKFKMAECTSEWLHNLTPIMVPKTRDLSDYFDVLSLPKFDGSTLEVLMRVYSTVTMIHSCCNSQRRSHSR